MSKILGLDLGTNSIGWALVDDSEKKIIGMGSRIIPMGDTKTEYEQGATISRNAQRRTLRSSRRMNKRFKLRRNKLLYVLNEIDCLPDQFIFKNGIPESNKIQELELQPISKGSLQLDSVGYYESRVTALTEPVTKKNFGKILYGFNSLRGYAGGDNEEDIASIDDNENKANKSETFVRRVEIKKVEKTDIKFKPKKKDNDSELNKYKVSFLLDNEEKEAITELQNLEAETEEELEIRIKRTKSETTITLHLPNKTSWRKEMENNEEKLKDKSLTISELILSELRNDRYKKVRNQVFLRHRYQEEFDKVWEEQAKHYQFLNNCPKEKLNKIANYLFPGVKETQVELREEAINKGLYHIIRNQIIYYQRPIKPQTDLIRKCSFEKDEPVIPISHPLFQEFRCWKQINNLNITTKEEVWNDKKRKKIYQYTETQLTKEQKINIYEKLTSQKSVGYNDIRNILNIKKDDKSTYINGISPKEKFVGLETIYSITKVLGYKPDDDKIIGIWNSLYNSTGSEYDINSDKIKALKEYVSEDQALELAKKIKFVKRYGNLSEKAIKRILPLMQCKEAIVDNDAILKFNSIKSGEYINDIEDYVKEYIYKNDEIDNGMMEYMALSFIYGRHTKSEVQIQIKNYHEIKYKERKLRNPIVEQLCNESMQIIKSIWKKYSLDMSDLKINVELARDLKNSAAERAKIDERQKANKTINETIKQRLLELKKYSPDNLETYKIWSKQSIEEYPKFKKAKDPTLEEKETLILWEEQKCVSPYTNKPIPLSRLFDKNEYNIDHIIPKQRFFDDSSSNKVICERSINIEKNNRTAWEYITNQNSKYEILGIKEYLNHINKNYYSKKKKNLLAEKIPNDFINRQLKDTQYISVAVRDELALIVGSDNVNSTTGEITDFLRSRWGLKKLFMEQTEERFKRMELWDNQRKWIERYDNEDGKNIYKIRYWSKRYDHRHHAIDALVVALTDNSDIYKLNNLNKELQDWLVKNKEQIGLNTEDNEGILESFLNLDEQKRESIQKQIPSFKDFKSPIPDLVSQTKEHLEAIIVSHKSKDTLTLQEKEINNKPTKYIKIRGALHEATIYGNTNGRDTCVKDISNISKKDINKILCKDLRDQITSHGEKYKNMKEAFSGEGLKTFNDNRLLNKQRPVYKVKCWYSNKEKNDTLKKIYKSNDRYKVKEGNNYIFAVMLNGEKRVFDSMSLFSAAKIAKKEFYQNKNEDFKSEIFEDIRKRNKATKILFTLRINDLVYMPSKNDTNFDISLFKEWIKNKDNKKDFAKRVYRVVKINNKECFFIPHNYASPINIEKDLSLDEIKTIKEEQLDELNKKKVPMSETHFVEFGSYMNCSIVEFGDDAVNALLNSKDKERNKDLRRIQDYCYKLEVDWLGNVNIINS